MKVIAIGGVPASGKTTLMFEILKRLSAVCMPIHFKEGLVVGLQYPRLKTYVIGDYTAYTTFAGTDKMSMAAQPAVLNWLLTIPYDATVLFEGDRLFNASFFQKIQATENLYIYILLVHEHIQKERCEERHSDQSPAFMKGRITKLANIQKSFGVNLLDNDTPEQERHNVEVILAQTAEAND